MKKTALLAGLGCALAAAPLAAQKAVQAPASPVIEVGGESFATWQDYLQSNRFQALGLRCGTVEVDPDLGFRQPPSDCGLGQTLISNQYNPSNGLFQIPVVVHVIENTNGAGKISDALVQSQIDILNEDFQALAGSNGANGTQAMIQFYLADRDPNGQPTTGITRSVNNTWFNDSGQYWNTLAWDTNRYLNIYTNQAGGALGYVPGFPAGGIVGNNSDRVVILWSTFGRNAPFGPPYNQGRTATHEVGHYFGLYHTFQGGCQPAAGCYFNGDLICDTNPDGTSHFGCPNTNSCQSPDPVTNYMEYTDDLCMEEFTPEQVNRMRCTLTHYRNQLSRPPAGCPAAAVTKRIAGANADVYTATPVNVGQNVTLQADTLGFPSASFFGVLQSANFPLDNGDVGLIVFDGAFFFHYPSVPGPIATVNDVIVNDPSLCGLTIYSQAVLHGTPIRPNFKLTNSQDLLVGP